jgi:dipeptidyl aminopeptidase/acylaminoacyl peptidase/tRNA A-37 threonylcarbamoyl transferase component Bud32
VPESASLSAGDRLGRYEIIAMIGAGGMGEVYRARDPQLHRDVALKILRRHSASEEGVKRFTLEARAAGSLNHPNIVAVYDVGVEAGTPFVVSELLEGETLRARLDRGPVTFHKAVEYAVQIADALAAAHARTIWHRDVKPANAFITNDGRVKLLDFGIAKLGEQRLVSNTTDTTEDLSDRHHVIGTPGYMAPEQVLGRPCDHRTDLFALGTVLYEMLTRKQAFKRASSVETMTAVLNDDPLDALTSNPNLPPMAAAIVRRCLEKNPEERFQSARDLSFDLHQLLGVNTDRRPVVPSPAVRGRTIARALVAVAVIAGAMVAGWLIARPPPPPSFEQLTFRRARISAARFVSDGRSVVYSESPQGNALQLWRLNLGENPPTRPLDLPDGTDILAARAGELVLSVNRRFLLGERFVGTLAVAPLSGGAPKNLEDNIEDADWDAQHSQMAVVRSTGGIGGRSWLEYPSGTRLHETTGSIRFPRLSPDGKRLAFIEDSIGSAEGGRVWMATIGGTPMVTPLTEKWKFIRGLAWSPDGSEIWFTAGVSRSNRELMAVSPTGRQRVLMAAPGSLTLWDVARDGRVLLSRDDERRSLVGITPGETTERELSLFDDTGLADISDDGKRLLFSDRFGVYIRDVDKTLPARLDLTDAYADELSADGEQVLATSRDGRSLMILPTGTGSLRKLPAHNIESYNGARWFADGQRVLFAGREPGHDLRSYVQDIKGGAPVALTPEHTWALAISHDGRYAAAVSDKEAGVTLWSIDGSSPPRRLAGSETDDRPVCFSKDNTALWIFRRGEVPGQVIRLGIANGKREVWKPLLPADVAGVYSITEFAITPDGKAYFYSYRRVLSQLYIVTGLR